MEGGMYPEVPGWRKTWPVGDLLGGWDRRNLAKGATATWTGRLFAVDNVAPAF